MGKAIKYLIFLVVLVFAGLLGFAYLGDLSAPQSEVTIIVEPDAS